MTARVRGHSHFSDIDFKKILERYHLHLFEERRHLKARTGFLESDRGRLNARTGLSVDCIVIMLETGRLASNGDRLHLEARTFVNCESEMNDLRRPCCCEEPRRKPQLGSLDRLTTSRRETLTIVACPGGGAAIHH